MQEWRIFRLILLLLVLFCISDKERANNTRNANNIQNIIILRQVVCICNVLQKLTTKLVFCVWLSENVHAKQYYYYYCWGNMIIFWEYDHHNKTI